MAIAVFAKVANNAIQNNNKSLFFKNDSSSVITDSEKYRVSKGGIGQIFTTFFHELK